MTQLRRVRLSVMQRTNMWSRWKAGQSLHVPASLRRSLTWDRGLEMAKHKTFTVATNVKVYFCDPQSPWQRRSEEHTSELQSHSDLVCRLLLEKKKQLACPHRPLFHSTQIDSNTRRVE